MFHYGRNLLCQPITGQGSVFATEAVFYITFHGADDLSRINSSPAGVAGGCVGRLNPTKVLKVQNSNPASELLANLSLREINPFTFTREKKKLLRQL